MLLRNVTVSGVAQFCPDGNPVAGAVKEPRIWELDFWGLTAREGAERLAEAGYPGPIVLPTANTSLPWGGREPSDDVDATSVGSAYAFLRWDSALPPGCTLLFRIERDGHVLGIGGACPDNTPQPE